jgi:hypothetical protein
MKVANDENAAADSYILVEFGGAKKLIGFELLFQSLLAGWYIICGPFHVSDDAQREKLREPSKGEETMIAEVMRQYSRRRDL